MKVRAVHFLLAGALLGSGAVAATDSAAFVSDSPITAQVKEKLKGDGMSAIEVETDKKGEVWLSGTVASQSVAEDAVQIAKTTKGVKAVHSYIEVKKEGKRKGKSACRTSPF